MAILPPKKNQPSHSLYRDAKCHIADHRANSRSLQDSTPYTNFSNVAYTLYTLSEARAWQREADDPKEKIFQTKIRDLFCYSAYKTLLVHRRNLQHQFVKTPSAGPSRSSRSCLSKVESHAFFRDAETDEHLFALLEEVVQLGRCQQCKWGAGLSCAVPDIICKLGEAFLEDEAHNLEITFVLVCTVQNEIKRVLGDDLGRGFADLQTYGDRLARSLSSWTKFTRSHFESGSSDPTAEWRKWDKEMCKVLKIITQWVKKDFVAEAKKASKLRNVRESREFLYEVIQRQHSSTTVSNDDLKPNNTSNGIADVNIDYVRALQFMAEEMDAHEPNVTFHYLSLNQRCAKLLQAIRPSNFGYKREHLAGIFENDNSWGSVIVYSWLLLAEDVGTMVLLRWPQ